MYLLFDIGGTSTRLCLIDNLNNELDINSVTKIPTPQEYFEGIKSIEKYLKDRNALGKVKHTVGGIGGVYDRNEGILLNAPNLPQWNGKYLGQEISRLTGSEVYIENDAALACLGESVYGEAKDFNIVTYITVSTGVGGAKVVNREIEKTVFGFEPGHQLIQINGEHKELEDLISGKSLQSRFKREPIEIQDPQVWKDVEYYLSLGLHNTILHWSPEVVVIGGAIGRSLDLRNVESILLSVMKTFPSLPEIRKSKLRHNVVHGALHFLKQKVTNN